MRGALSDLARTTPSVARFEARALELLTRHLGADAAFFGVKGAEPALTSLGIDAESTARLLHHSQCYERELWPVKRAALAARGVAVDTAVLGEGEVRRTRYFRDLVARERGRHTLVACITWRDQLRGMLVLGRRGVSFSPAELEQVEALLPELALARATYAWPAVESPLGVPAGGWRARLMRRDRKLASASTPYGELSVRDRDGFRELVATEDERELVWTRAALDQPSRSGWPYIELFHVAAASAAQRRRALFIGLGGAVAVRQFARAYPGIALDVVERDVRVVELARQWFDLDAIPGLAVHVADGADFVASYRGERWDILIVDTYAHGFVEAFGRRPFFAAARGAVARGGTLALNLIGTIDGRGDLPRVLAAARGEFDEPRVLPVLEAAAPCEPAALRNVVVVWSKR